MLYRDTVDLITVAQTQDADGYMTDVETSRTVYADVNNATRQEFYEAYKAGLQIALSIIIRYEDYEGEKLVEFNGKRYKVERLYSSDRERMELNCSEVIR